MNSVNYDNNFLITVDVPCVNTATATLALLEPCLDAGGKGGEGGMRNKYM